MAASAKKMALELENAIEERDVGRVDRVLAEGADLNTRDDGGWTPLHKAVAAGDIAIVQRLLAAGADPSAEDNAAWTPAMHAELYQLPEVAALLEESAT